MLYFFKVLVIIFIFFKLFLISFFEFYDDFSVHSSYVYFIFVFILFNYKINDINTNKFDFDLLYKFLYLTFKTPSFFLNYFVNTLKQVIHFLAFFRFRNLFNTIKLIFKKYFINFFIIWKPLFKKTSYFGYYRSNRSKWIK